MSPAYAEFRRQQETAATPFRDVTAHITPRDGNSFSLIISTRRSIGRELRLLNAQHPNAKEIEIREASRPTSTNVSIDRFIMSKPVERRPEAPAPEDCQYCGDPIDGGNGGLCRACLADSETDADAIDRAQQRLHREFGR